MTTTEQETGPLTRRIAAAAEEARVAAEIAELDALGYHDVAELVRDRAYGRAS